MRRTLLTAVIATASLFALGGTALADDPALAGVEPDADLAPGRGAERLQQGLQVGGGDDGAVSVRLGGACGGASRTLPGLCGHRAFLSWTCFTAGTLPREVVPKLPNSRSRSWVLQVLSLGRSA